MIPKVYVDTSIVSYLTARPSRDLIVAANQELTREWWESRRQDFELLISEFVVREASAGDAEAARRRLEAIQGLPRLLVTRDVAQLTKTLLEGVPLPPKAQLDAFHIAVAAFHGVDYLLTWNCKHIHNAVFRPKIESLCRSQQLEPPIICTPQELMEE